MEAELKALEEKISQLAQFCQQLRAENMQLRQQLAGEQNTSKQLNDKISGAKSRLEDILQKIPEESE